MNFRGLSLIEECDGEISYLVVCVLKKDRALRLCVDFRSLRGSNSNTGFSYFPMLAYEEILPHVYSLHNSFIENLFLASKNSVLTKRCSFFQIYFIQF